MELPLPPLLGVWPGADLLSSGLHPHHPLPSHPPPPPDGEYGPATVLDQPPPSVFGL